MARAYQCDRCGTLFLGENYKRISFNYEQEMQICPFCYKIIKTFATHQFQEIDFMERILELSKEETNHETC